MIVRPEKRALLHSQECVYLSQTLAPSVGGTLSGYFYSLVMWAFFEIICLHSNFRRYKMYILVTLYFNFTWIHHGMIEIAWYHKNPTFLLKEVTTIWFAAKFWSILMKYYSVKVHFSSKTLKPNIQHLIESRRRRPEVTKSPRHFLQSISTILVSNETLWNSKTFDVYLAFVRPRMLEILDF